ncbi:ribonuclease III domain-containing protein [Plectosphaerella cucumerina]|uniref:Ribonuclease III domain-containing protein n=1 Tax=Plectosphaerella cucumerina TaxID=40658 RepID=A0A8K0TJG8_9PEZI|nr:ribonuclease III domain-containing protein [Plectosphaerella cucumerina]
MTNKTQAKLEEVMKTLSYEFREPEWLIEALAGNKRLAGVGHRLINMVITEWAFDEGLLIGQTNQQLQQTVSNPRLVAIFDMQGFASCIMNIPSQQGGVSARTNAATVEAIIGAIYKDGGMEPAKAAMTLFGII